MLSEISIGARQLADYMSELSEEAYDAGWMHDLEHALWRAIVTGPYRYGRLDITAEHVVVLQWLSNSCGGWVHFGETEEAFVPLGEWREMYDPARAL